MKKFIFMVVCAVCAVTASVSVRAAVKQTYVFSATATDTLLMDVYHAERTTPGPAVIFAFGGGFVGGSRDEVRYEPMFRFLSDNGITVISTDYRTLLKNLPKTALANPEAVLKGLVGAVTAAVEDFYKATAFTLVNSGNWCINPEQIYACGSSAGAVTALMAEYRLINRDEAMPGFPVGFNYAGVISFAGAILSNGPLEWKRQPAPMLLFHGNNDSNVPFDQLTLGPVGLRGSLAISNSLFDNGYQYWFYRVNGADHSVATTPMVENVGRIYDFIHAVGEHRLYRTVILEDLPGSSSQPAQLTLEDFIRANFK